MPDCFCPILSAGDAVEVALDCLCQVYDCPTRTEVYGVEGHCGTFQSFGYVYWGTNWYQFEGERLVGIYLSTDYPAFCGYTALRAGDTSCEPRWPPPPNPPVMCEGGTSSEGGVPYLGGMGGCVWE